MFNHIGFDFKTDFHSIYFIPKVFFQIFFIFYVNGMTLQKENRPIKMNAAAILREGSLFQKKEKQELQK